MKIYIDSDFKCHVDPAENRREFDVSFFDGKCDAFVEGYRCVPRGEQWVQPDGVVLKGVMISPWKPYSELYKAQLEYELAVLKTKLTDAEAALEILEVTE